LLDQKETKNQVRTILPPALQFFILAQLDKKLTFPPTLARCSDWPALFFLCFIDLQNSETTAVTDSGQLLGEIRQNMLVLCGCRGHSSSTPDAGHVRSASGGVEVAPCGSA